MSALWALTGSIDARPAQDDKVSDIINDESTVSKLFFLKLPELVFRLDSLAHVHERRPRKLQYAGQLITLHLSLLGPKQNQEDHSPSF